MAGESTCVKQIRDELIGKSGLLAIVVELIGDIDFHHTPEVHEILVATCARKPHRLVIDLGHVNYMDSSGIGTLVDVYRRTNAGGGRLVLCGLNERVYNLFEITKLDKFFKIVLSIAEAVTE